MGVSPATRCSGWCIVLRIAQRRCRRTHHRFRTRCTKDLNIMGGIQSTPSTGNVPTTVANLDAAWYTVAGNGDHVVVKYVVAHAEGSDVRFAMDRFLNSATLSATLSGKLCDPDCAPAPNTFAITASWTATGPLIRLLDNTRVVSPHQGGSTSHDRSAQRTAAATGSIAGAPVTGAFTASDATLGTDNFSERLVQRQPPTSRGIRWEQSALSAQVVGSDWLVLNCVVGVALVPTKSPYPEYSKTSRGTSNCLMIEGRTDGSGMQSRNVGPTPAASLASPSVERDCGSRPVNQPA